LYLGYLPVHKLHAIPQTQHGLLNINRLRTMVDPHNTLSSSTLMGLEPYDRFNLNDQRLVQKGRFP